MEKIDAVLHQEGKAVPLASLSDIVPRAKFNGLLSYEEIRKPLAERRAPFGKAIYKDFATEVWRVLCHKENIRGDAQIAWVRSQLRDQIVVDLGVGNIAIYSLACSVGAKGYIAVEPFWSEDVIAAFNAGHSHEYSKSPLTGNQIPAAVVRDDALSFLRRLPDGTVSIFAGGLDRQVLPNDEYAEKLGKEMGRVLHKDGLLIAVASRMFETGLQHEPLNLIGGAHDYIAYVPTE